MEGSIKDLAHLEVYAENIYPCNIGTSAFTSYSHADHMDALEEVFPQYSLMGDERWDGQNCISGYKIHQIHTHHNMDAFFSGTDKKDLHDNTPNHGFYISLIVNFNGNFVCKGAFLAKTKVNTTLDLSDYNLSMRIKEEEEALITFDFDIQDEVQPWLEEQLDNLKVLVAEREARQKLAKVNRGNFTAQDPSSKFPTRKPFIHADLRAEEYE